MRSFLSRATLVACLFAYGLSANPIALKNLVSEIQVIDPSQWAIEFQATEPSHWFFESNVYDYLHVALISNRYADTTIVTSSKFINGHAVLVSDSVKPPDVFEIEKGDSVKVMFLDNWWYMNDSIDVIVSEDIVIDYVGPDSSMCLCGAISYRLTGTPTIGSSNIFPANEKTLYVMSIEDSLPVTGLGLYIPKYGACDSLFREISDQGIVSFPVGPCQTNTFVINDHKACFNNLGMETVSYTYQDGALPENDTVFLTELAAHETGHSEKKHENLNVIHTSNQSIIIVNSSSNTSGPAECRIYNAVGQLVRALATNIKGPGTYSIGWDRADLKGMAVGAGAYFIQLRGKNISLAKRFTLQ